MADIKITNGYDGLNLPYSPEAEQSVLGAVLIASECLDEIREIVPSPEYFHLVNHRVIYNAMLELSDKAIDFITVNEYLKHNKDIDGDNIRNYLYQLSQIVPSVSNVKAYAKIVAEKYKIRTLILTAREIIEDASSGEYESETLIDSAEQRIFDIRSGRNILGLQKIDEVIIETFDRLDLLNSENSDQFKPVSTGVADLDRVITGLNKTDLILLAARPGMGKTSFALNIARNVAVQSKKTVAFFSLEMPTEQLASRLLATEGLIEGTKLRTGKLNSDEWIRLVEAGDILSKTNIYLDGSNEQSVLNMKAKLRRLKNLDLVIIDYLQLMSGSRRIDNRVQEISEITRNLKIMAKELNVPVITLSQLSRASETRADHKPQLSDLRDSGSIEQDADIVMFLYREDYYNKNDENAENVDQNKGICFVAKNRHGEIADVNLHWQGEFMRFTSVEGYREE